MKNIPTAEELFYSKFKKEGGLISNEDLIEYAIDFAKLHVEAAIKMCIEEAPSGSSTDTVSYEDVVEALTDYYPLDLIK